MISRIRGQLIEQRATSVLLETQGMTYEVHVPVCLSQTLAQSAEAEGYLELITYYYHQLEPSRAVPILIGFTNEIERDFFESFISVSGIGPKAAVRALNQPIPAIARAIDEGDVVFLKGLQGIGPQRAREIVAKLQGKVGKYGLLPDQESAPVVAIPDSGAEALEVLLQLQYKPAEAEKMIQTALERNPKLESAEDILNEVYRQKAGPVSV